MGKALSMMIVTALVGVLGVTAPVRAEDANLACGHWHGDPPPGYVGPVPLGIECRYSIAPSVTWTVPDEVTTARFYVFGASDPSLGSPGGKVAATLDLNPGSGLTLKMGGSGKSSVVLLGETPLLIAGGGNGTESNYVSPFASQVNSEEPGSSKGWPLSEGWIAVEWSYFYGDPIGEEPEDPLEETLLLPEVPQPPAPSLQSSSCIVPRLKGLSPVAARKALFLAHCALGEVSRRPARQARRGRIVRQFPPAGAALTAGAAVNVVVGRRP